MEEWKERNKVEEEKEGKEREEKKEGREKKEGKGVVKVCVNSETYNEEIDFVSDEILLKENKYQIQWHHGYCSGCTLSKH